MKNKIIFQYILGLGIIYMLSGFNFLTTGLTSLFYSFVMVSYFTWLVSRCRECDNVDNKIFAKVLAVVSSVSTFSLLAISAFDKEYFSSYKDTIIILFLAVGSAVFLYYFNLFSFGFEVNRFREHRKKKKKKERNNR